MKGIIFWSVKHRAVCLLARPVNLDFPKFDSIDPTNWVLKAQQYFAFGQIPDNQRVPIAYFHMEGKALQ